LRAYNAAKCNCSWSSARIPLGVLQRFPDPLAGFKGKEKEGRGREGGEWEGREVDSDAQLEQGR